MDDEYKQLLEENLKVAKENNEMLHAMRREALIGRIIKVLMVFVAIGVPVYLYFSVLQPYVQDARATFEQVQSRVEQVGETSDTAPWLRSLIGGSDAAPTSTKQ
jgi:hypothetical protein